MGTYHMNEEIWVKMEQVSFPSEERCKNSQESCKILPTLLLCLKHWCVSPKRQQVFYEQAVRPVWSYVRTKESLDTGNIVVVLMSELSDWFLFLYFSVILSYHWFVILQNFRDINTSASLLPFIFPGRKL